ncbi:MAG: antibiotic biosynthesis monooxygenase [Proteobacteria bacterium]|nr:antibiotic biosynthesis monooxygenase [Pseudomonadota bacterium]
MTRIALIIRHRTLPGRRDDARRAWEAHMRPAIAANPGHLAYVYCQDDSDSDVLSAFQMYASHEDAQRFLQAPSYLRYLEAVGPCLAGPPDVLTLNPLWAKGD